MNEKFPLTSIGVLDADIQKWYLAEQCWNCEPEDLQKMRIGKKRPAKRRLIKRA